MFSFETWHDASICSIFVRFYFSLFPKFCCRQNVENRMIRYCLLSNFPVLGARKMLSTSKWNMRGTVNNLTRSCLGISCQAK